MQELVAALGAQGFECTPVFTGEIIRFNRNGKNLNGWFEGYVVDGPHGPVYKARYGDWATGETHTWSSDQNTVYTKEDLEKLRAAQAKMDEERTKAKLAEQEKAAEKAKEIWAKAALPNKNHAYLLKKKVPPTGLKQINSELVIPIVNNDSLVSLQFIDDKGQKRFLSGGKLKGSYHVIPGEGDEVYVTEGWATGMSVSQATKGKVVVAFNAHGLISWAEAQGPGTTKVVICADNDQWTTGNPGVTSAKKAAGILQTKGYSVSVNYPEFDKNGEKLTDWNDYAVKFGLENAREKLSYKEELPVSGTKKRLTLRDLYHEKLEPLPWRTVNNKPRPPTQDQVASALADTYRGILIREVEDVFLWTGDHWVELDPKNFKRFIRDRAQVLMGGAAADKDLNAYYNILMDKLPRVPENSSFFQQLPNLCNFQDGTLEILRCKGSGEYKMQFREHRREDLLTWVIPFNYLDPRPANPIFDDWLKRSFEGDYDAAGKIRALKQIGGACLISLFPRIAFLYGVPGTGKSTFAKLCIRFMGKGNYSAVEPKHQDGFMKETMINRQANIVTDISEAYVDPAQWKRVEDRVPELINRKNKRAVLGHLPALHIYCGNQLPKGIDGATSAMDRRVTIVEWLNSVVKDDAHTREYEELIMDAGPGAVLQFFVEGLEDLIAHKGIYFNPESGKRKLQDWKLQNDPVGQFLEAVKYGEIGENNAKLQLKSDAKILRSEVSNAFKKWLECLPQKARVPALFSDLESRGYAVQKSNGVRYIHGFWVEGRVPRAGEGAPGSAQGSEDFSPAPDLSY